MVNGNYAYIFGVIDSLTVYYGGNQVRLVTDAVTTDYGHPAEYRDGEATWYEHNHDKNGNLVCDLDRGVTSIGYNILNLPERVELPGNHSTYNIYDADGRKLRTVHIVIYDEVVTPGGETIIPADTLVRDYSGSHIYENGVLERTLTPTGYYSSADSQYCYYIKDYQGNNIAVVKADANGVPEVVSATLMYPFGGELTEMSATDRYRFGGKELDTRGGLFHYDFAARHYDPVLPMFNGYDPMAEDNIHVSPLAYCHGNPVMFIDPTGMFDLENIGPNINLPVVAIFPSDRDAALEKDIRAARDAKVPIVIVDDSADFQEALDVMANQGTSTDAYVINSHGKDGKFYVGESVINEKNAENFGKTFEEDFNGKTVVISACNVAETEKGESVIEKISGASNSTVIGSSHRIPAGYKYDGSHKLNKITFKSYPRIGNEYHISTNGSKSRKILNLVISSNNGLGWFDPQKPSFRYW